MVAKSCRNPISLGLLPKSDRSTLVKNGQTDDMDIVKPVKFGEPLNGSPMALSNGIVYLQANLFYKAI
jgi:hypothetical protein